MKFCDDHWAKLRAAISKRGLDHLVARGGKEAVDRLVDEVKGTETAATFDPLMCAHNMVASKALELGGLYMLTGEDICPVCEAVKNECGDESYWIDGPADAALEEAKKIGMIPTPGVPEEEPDGPT